MNYNQMLLKLMPNELILYCTITTIQEIPRSILDRPVINIYKLIQVITNPNFEEYEEQETQKILSDLSDVATKINDKYKDGKIKFDIFSRKSQRAATRAADTLEKLETIKQLNSKFFERLQASYENDLPRLLANETITKKDGTYVTTLSKGHLFRCNVLKNKTIITNNYNKKGQDIYDILFGKVEATPNSEK